MLEFLSNVIGVSLLVLGVIYILGMIWFTLVALADIVRDILK